MKTFTVIWSGQLVSLVGTAMTRFALLVWAYQQTGQATTLALLGFFSFALSIIISPAAGVLVDRWDRRLVMLLTDLGAGLMTVAVLLLYLTGGLQIWHLYVAEALTGAFEAFQVPAYSAASTLLVPKKHLTRANGMRSLAYWASRVGAPFLAGLLLHAVGIAGVMLVDVLTFLIAMGTLLHVRIPRPAVTDEGRKSSGSFWREMGSGFRYIRQRRGLLGLLLMFMGINGVSSLTYLALMSPLILARTGGDELALASVQAAFGVGGLIGGLLVSTWGGPKRRIHGVLAGSALSFMLGDFMFAVGQHVGVWCLAAFASSLFVPFIVAANRAIWQIKTSPDMQGRVLGVYNALSESPIAFGMLIAGPLADRVLEPAMVPGGTLAGIFGGLVGTGPGAGMGLMFFFTCISGLLVSLSGYLLPSVRNIEADLPDYDAQPEAQTVGQLAEATAD